MPTTSSPSSTFSRQLARLLPQALAVLVPPAAR